MLHSDPPGTGVDTSLGSLESAPGLDAIRSVQSRIAPWIVQTPTLRCAGLEAVIPGPVSVHGKLEFLQRTGTFKARGALATIGALDAAARTAGVTACSAGNHAIAVAYAASVLDTSAKVVMLASASPLRVERCREFGAEVVLVDDVHSAFSEAERISRDEGRYFVQPFEGPSIALGTATLGMELCDQLPDFDTLLVPVGGGGLLAGVACAVRQRRPECRIVGVEPEGADTMRRSFAAQAPQSIEAVKTIADSLGAPFAMPYSFALCRQFADEIVTVSDRLLSRAMRVLFREQKIAVEPACAAGTAALLGPLADEVVGSKVAMVFCGSNIDWGHWAESAGFYG